METALFGSNDRREFSLRRIYHTQRLPARVVAESSGYDTLSAPPRQLIRDDGNYRTGWFTHFDGDVNLSASPVAARHLHQWFFVHFDTPDYFVGMNIAHLGLGGNTGIVVLDKRSGEFSVESETGILLRNPVRISRQSRRFVDERQRAVIAIDDRDQRLDFDVRTRSLRVLGAANALFERPFVQSTRFHGGHGTLQSWGNFAISDATLQLGGRRVRIPEGTLGAYDRSLGHRRPLENWNWLVATGRANDAETGEEALFSVHLARDRAAARPQVDARKFSLWLGAHHVKLHDVRFEYAITDPTTRASSTWHVVSAPGPAEVALTFAPLFHRRDRHHIPLLLRVDHSQYFGELSGEIVLHGKRYLVQKVFASAEDSRMIF